MSKSIELQVNGTAHIVQVEPEQTLLSVLRDELDLTGCKYGCGEGQCGACTVLVDGRSIRSCITPASSAVGKPIATIEGLEKEGRLHPLQEAFIALGAMQCGYCIPGMIMSAIGLLEKNPHPTEPEILRFMEGNLCRCGMYPRILAAIRLAAEMEKRGER
jgi:aerobic-type carbon monoxide dehydrogenase small subunit (CoxS/CutS family)